MKRVEKKVVNVIISMEWEKKYMRTDYPQNEDVKCDRGGNKCCNRVEKNIVKGLMGMKCVKIWGTGM